jgi:hypothetical protein
MEIIIEGWRAGGDERKEAASVPANQLPPLTDEQKSVAKKMGIAEEDYARSAYAGRRNQQRLIEKTRRFGEILEAKLGSKVQGARIDRIRLLTIEHEYRIELSVEGKKVLFRVAEDMVDDFMERGFADIGQKIEQNLETVLAVQAAPSRHGQT